MNTIDALNSRYCCRAFKPKQVSKQKVQRVLEAAIRAPSWANTQPWEIYIASGEPLERLRKTYLANHEKGVPGTPDLPRPQSWPPALQKRTEELMAKREGVLGIARDDKTGREAMLAANYRFFDAPVVIYLCMDRTLTPWSVFDLGLLAQSIMLAAKGNGLDTAPAVMLVSYPDLIRAELGIPDSLSIIIGIALGFGNHKNTTNKFCSPRRPLSEVMHIKGF
jgi:nitroreductase